MNQGTKFALALILIMVSSVLLFVSFHNTEISGQPIKNPADFIKWIQAIVKGGPTSTGSDAVAQVQKAATTATAVATQAVNQAVTP